MGWDGTSGSAVKMASRSDFLDAAPSATSYRSTFEPDACISCAVAVDASLAASKAPFVDRFGFFFIITISVVAKVGTDRSLY